MSDSAPAGESHGRGPLEHLRRLFAWNGNANRAALAALVAAAPTPRAATILAHVVAAERLWLARLKGEAAAVPVWPEWGPEATAREEAGVRSDWEAYVTPLRTEDLTRQVRYVDSKGMPGEASVEAILLHVIAHSAYHRSQAALALSLRSDRDATALPEEPAATPRGLVE